MKSGEDKKDLPVLGHIAELRKYAIISILSVVAASVISFILYEGIINILYRPLEVLEKDQIGHLLYINTIFEGFVTRLRISLLSGIILSFPIHLLNLVFFVFPGLKRKEKNVVPVSLLCSFLFIVLSFLYSYYKIIPISVVFLTGDGFIPEKAGMLLSFSGNIFYILQFMLWPSWFSRYR